MYVADSDKSMAGAETNIDHIGFLITVSTRRGTRVVKAPSGCCLSQSRHSNRPFTNAKSPFPPFCQS